jgi:hypothetical protein
MRSPLHRCSRISALVLGLFSAGCVRSYAPRTPRMATAKDAGLTLTNIDTASASAIYPPAGAVGVGARYRVEPGAALTTVRLAPTSASPCEGGVAATAMAMVGDATALSNADGAPPKTGRLMLVFSRAALDQAGLLSREPTSLDVGVLPAGEHAERTCLRIPVVEGNAEPEWAEDPVSSAGYAFGVLAPFTRIYAVDAAPMFALRFGRWLGPLRLQGEGLVGGAAAHTANANLVGYSYGGGVLADTLLMHAGRFGIGAGVGYQLLGISFSPNVESLSHEGSGFQGVIHGPRAGLSFALLPGVPPGPAFRARPNTSSTALEIFAAAQWSRDHERATPALWMAITVDAGW